MSEDKINGIRKAKREYRCAWCKKTIGIGQEYYSTFSRKNVYCSKKCNDSQ